MFTRVRRYPGRMHARTVVFFVMALWFLPGNLMSVQHTNSRSKPTVSDGDQEVRGKIHLAMAAGPPDVASAARIVDKDDQGK